jgi:tRNA nucleotidyltransferase (CCA-adding enzyme)
MDVITSHFNADFDALGSMVAAKRLYPEGVLVFPGSQEKKVREFLDDFHPVEVDIKRIKDIDFTRVSRLILVDTKSPERIGVFAELARRPGVKIHIFDHHPPEKGDLKGEIEIVEPVGATATIMAEFCRKKNIKLTPMEATMLALGVYEETGNLLFPSTTERDVNAAAYLLKSGASLKIVSTYVKAGLGKEEVSVLKTLLDNSEDIIVRGLAIKIAKAAVDSYMGDAAHLAHTIMDMENIDAAIVMLSMEGKIIMIGRSRAQELNIGEVFSEFGGGGHWSAASATLPEVPLELLEEQVTECIKKHVKPEMNAGDVMTRPVVTIEYKSTIKQAETRMTRYGVNVLPVLKDGKYMGIISREVVEKALFHGFGRSKVTDFTTTDVFTVTPKTPVREVEALMIEQNQRFMPVLEGDRILGAITRTDILRVLYEDYLRRTHLPPEEAGAKRQGRMLAGMLEEKYPENVYRVLRAAGETAERMNYSVYMVGGSVRDLLRGEENLDIDLVVEGDAMELARELAKMLGGKVRTHERFGTAELKVDGMKYDLATARTEYYEEPAALPKVELSSIKRDLQRRDFTINTLAIKLNPREFGLLVDFFGGRRDLREKTLRVLHDLSFVEDPTRAFRAVRFAVRFGFKLSKHTEELLKAALKMNLFEKLSGARLYDELLLIFKETEPIEAIKKLADYGLLKVIHLSLKLNEALVSTLGSAHDTLLWFELSFLEEKAEKWLVYLMALLSGLSEGEREEALSRLGVSPKVKKECMHGLQGAREALGKLPLRDPGRIYEELSGVSLEGLLIAMALAGDTEKKKEISRYLLDFRREKPLMNGDDLLKMGLPPGPEYGRILKSVLEERLRGRLKSKEDELRFVRERFIRSA